MLIIKSQGIMDYDKAWEAMKAFTDERDEHTPDEIWFLEHPPVYTQGQAGKPEHILNPGQIPIIQSDRGGQVTYHGPGQLVTYFLIDIERLKLSIRQFVCDLESMIIDMLSEYDILGARIANKPGVYVNDRKIASIGLRVRKGRTYHGTAINIDMDLTPFQGINPCGHEALKMTQVKYHANNITLKQMNTLFQKKCRAYFKDHSKG